MKNALVQRLIAQKAIDDLSLNELAKRLGTSNSYLCELLRGTKDIAKANDDVVRNIAEYVNVPVVSALVLANKLRASDLQQQSFDEKLMSAMQSENAVEAVKAVVIERVRQALM